MITPFNALIRLYSLFPRVFLFSLSVSIVFFPLNYGFGWLIDIMFQNDSGVVFSIFTNEKSSLGIAKELVQAYMYVIFFACLLYLYIGGLLNYIYTQNTIFQSFLITLSKKLRLLLSFIFVCIVFVTLTAIALYLISLVGSMIYEQLFQNMRKGDSIEDHQQRLDVISIVMLVIIAGTVLLFIARFLIFVVHMFLLEEIESSFLLMKDMYSSIVESEEYMRGHWDNYLSTFFLSFLILVGCFLFILNATSDWAPFMLTEYEKMVIDGLTSFEMHKFIQALFHMSQAVFIFSFFITYFIIGTMIALAFVYYSDAIHFYEANQIEVEFEDDSNDDDLKHN